jgi:hypothetical protein
MRLAPCSCTKVLRWGERNQPGIVVDLTILGHGQAGPGQAAAASGACSSRQGGSRRSWYGHGRDSLGSAVPGEQ